jgi:hypothetical protein
VDTIEGGSDGVGKEGQGTRRVAEIILYIKIISDINQISTTSRVPREGKEFEGHAVASLVRKMLSLTI